MPTRTMYTNRTLFSNNIEISNRKITPRQRTTLGKNKAKRTREYEMDKQQDSLLQIDKDAFIDLATAALEEAYMEEERTSIWQELIEAFLHYTGVSRHFHAILEQFRSQDVIEKSAENNFDQQEQKRNLIFDRRVEKIILYYPRKDPS
ncbi:MAG: hypothetical protein EXX96DRAFT_509754, partial [Benjaminiella poitrasii]